MMYKKFISIIVSIGLILSAFPSGISAAVSDRSGKGNGENYDVVRLESPQAMASAVAETKSRKSLKRIRSGRYSDYEEEVRRRVVFKGETPKSGYGAKKVYYYSVGDFYIFEYNSAEAASEIVATMKKDSRSALIFQDDVVAQRESGDVDNTDSEDCEGCGDSADGDEHESSEHRKKKASSQDSIDGIRQMGLDRLKTAAERNPSGWRGKDGRITVAVIDSGVNRNHPWLRSRIDTANSVNLAQDYPGQPDRYDDIVGHGSHVSGVIAKATPSNVRIMAIRVFNVLGKASVLSITSGIDYARERGADVINMSFGEKNSTDAEQMFMGAAMQKAVSAGITLFAASGNDYGNVAGTLPANSAWTIAIGSIEPKAPITEFVNGVMMPVYNGNYSGAPVRSDFSNNGEILDFVGPGRYISSAWIGQPGVAAGYISSGTSMATPHLTAAAAMIKLRHRNYNQWDVYAALQDNTVDVGEPEKDFDTGYGYVDMSAYALNEVRSGKPHQVINTVVELYGNMNSVGKRTRLNVNLTKGDGKLTYVSSDSGVVRMNGNEATIVGPGRCDVTVTAQKTARYAKSTRRIKILVAKGKQRIIIKKKRYRKTRKSKPFYLKAKVGKPGNGRLTFHLAKKGVVKVSPAGKVRILKKGTAKVYAKAGATAGFYEALSEPIVIKVGKRKFSKGKKKHAKHRKARRRVRRAGKHGNKHVKDKKGGSRKGRKLSKRGKSGKSGKHRKGKRGKKNSS